MDWLRRAQQFIGNLAGGASRAIGGLTRGVQQNAGQAISRFIGPSVNQRLASLQQQQAIRQVQQAPKFQLPQIQIPKVQLPQAPKVDFGAVSRALGGIGQGLDITKRTAFGQQLTPQQQRLVSTSPQLQSQIRTFKAIQPTGQDITKLLRASAPAIDVGLAVKEKGLGAFAPQEIMQRGFVPAIQQQVSRTGQRLISTPEGQQLQRMPGIQGQIGRAAETAAFRPQQAITGTLQTGGKVIGEAPGIKQFNKTQVGKILSEYVVNPTTQSFIDTFGRVGGAQAGQKTYADGLKGYAQLANDIVNIGSAVYSGNLAGQLGTKGTPFLKTAAKLAPRLAASGAGQNIITQLAQGKKINEIDYRDVLGAATAYTALGIGLPGLQRAGGGIVNKLLGGAQGAVAGKVAKAVPGIPVTKAAQVGPTPRPIAENIPVSKLGAQAEKISQVTPVPPAQIKAINQDMIQARDIDRLNVGNVQGLSQSAKNSLENKAVGIKSGALERARNEILSGNLPPVKVEVTDLKGGANIIDGRHHLEAARQLGITNYPIDVIPNKFSKQLGVPTGEFLPTAQAKVAKPIYETVPKSAMEPKGPKAELPLNVKERGFVSSVKTSQEVSDDVRSAISGSYDIKSNQVLVNNADKLTKNTNKAIATVNEQLAKPMGTLSDQEVANAIVLAKKLDANKNMDAALNIYDQLSQHLTEAGRQVQAASLLSRRTPEGLLFSAQRTLKKANVEITPAIQKELQANIAAIKKTVIGTDERNMAIAKMQKDLIKHIPQKALDNIVSVWKAGLLSGVKTQGGNFLSNATFGIMKLGTNPLSAAADILMSKFTGKRTFALTARGLAGGGVEGAKKGIFTLRTGIDTRDLAGAANKFDQVAEINFKNKYVQKFIGTPSNLVFRGMSAADQPFYFAALKNSMYNQALAEAKNKGLKGQALNEFIGNTIKNANSDMVQTATFEAQKAVLGYDTVMSKIVSGIHKSIDQASFLSPTGKSTANAVINTVAPFTRVPSAFLSRTIDYTPLGPIKTIIGQISRKRFDQRALAQALSEGATGTGLIVLGAQLNKAGLLSGEYPKNDQKEQARWKAEGITPNSVKIGKDWISLNYLGPLGMLFGAGRNFDKSINEGNSIPEATLDSIAGFGSGLLQQSFLQGLSGWINALNEPGRYATNVVKQQIGSIVPSWINDIGNIVDKYKRQSTTPIEAAMARIPGLRQQLPAQTDVFGNKLLQGGIQTLNPLKPSPSISTGITSELDRLKAINPDYDVWPTPVNKKDFFGKGTELDKKQLNQVNAELGAQIQDAWTRTIATADYQNKSDSDKADLLSKVKKQVIEDYKINNDTQFGMEYTPKEKAQPKIAKYKKTLPKPKKWSKKGRKAKVAKVKIPRARKVSIAGIPKAPQIKLAKVSSKGIKLKQSPRKSIKIKTG